MNSRTKDTRVEWMVLNDDDQSMDTVYTRQSSKRFNISKGNCVRLGIGCGAIALLAVLVAFAILKSISDNSKSINSVNKKEDTQEIGLKVVLSTTYIPDSASQSVDIKNIDNTNPTEKKKEDEREQDWKEEKGNREQERQEEAKKEEATTEGEPKVEAIIEEEPKVEAIIEEEPKEETIIEEEPKEEKIIEEEPKDETIIEKEPKEEIIIEKEPKEEAITEEGPKEEATTEEGPKEEAKAEEGPKEEATTTEEAPKEEATTKKGPKAEATTKKGSKEEATTKKGSKGEATTKKGPKEEATTKKGPKAEATTEQRLEEVTRQESSKEEATTEQRLKEEAVTEEGLKEKATTEEARKEKESKEEETTATAAKAKKTNKTTALTTKIAKKPIKPMAPIKKVTNTSKNSSDDIEIPNIILKQSTCSMIIGKIVLVQMLGEQNTNIWDETQMDTVFSKAEKRKHRTVTLYEDTTYRMRVQLGCGERFDGTSFVNICDLSQTVHVWTDLNDNGYELSEKQDHHYHWSDNFIPEGMYDVNIHIPPIDGKHTKTGPHRMQVVVLPSEQYQRDCGNIRYNETRFYTVDIIPRANYAVATPAANIVYENPVCYLNMAKILLVLMAGEVGSQIRDDLPTNALLNDYQDRHHLSVTIYEQTAYLIRIRLDCSWQLNSDLFKHGCNLAQDVHILIDLNDDGHFDSTESATPYRWPVTSYMPEGIYDLQIHVPVIDEQYIKSGSHRMRLVVTSNDNYLRICTRYDHNETRDYTINIIPRARYHTQMNMATPYTGISDVACSLPLGKISLVLMAGEHRTQIRDDASTRTVMATNHYHQYQHYLSIALYEDMTYLLRIQLDCGQQSNKDAYLTHCHLIYEVNIWIDSNDDGIFDNSENVTPYHWPLHSYTPEGVYDIQVYTPIIDGHKVNSNPHRMSLVVTLTEQYSSKCSTFDYRDTREYTVTLLSNKRQTIYNGLSFLTLPENVCTQTNAHIVLVIMTGEKGTHIRDNSLSYTPLNENQNQHHLAISLYDDTTYRIRIQLDCPSPSSRGPLNINCNLAQDVNVYIDFNNDGRYDESESRVPHRWPLPSFMPLGIYDLEIYIPPAHEQNMGFGSHNMRVVVMPSEEYISRCGRTDYREVREYVINLMPRAIYAVDYRDIYCSAGNLVCLPGNSALSLVQLAGEQRTQIRDEMKRCSSANNFNDQTDLTTILYDQSVYQLRLQLYCVHPWGYINSYNQDPYLFQSSCTHARYIDVWIDMNNDEIFDTTRERMVSSDWYTDGRQIDDYNFNIVIPKIDGKYYLSGQHRMRITVTQDEKSRNPCSNTGYGESRDYTINIMPKLPYKM